MGKPSLFFLRKFAAVIFIIFLLGIALEAALRMAGGVYLYRLHLLSFKNTNPAPGSINIICLGESSTAGIWVAREETYPKQLEEKLRQFYPQDNINVIIPPHLGQNTSQIANRIKGYLNLYKPKLTILMAGYNNEWSLAESHIGLFLSDSSHEKIKVKSLIFLNNLRLFKLARYLWLRFITRDQSEYMVSNKHYVWGERELVRVPPEKWVYSFAAANREAFINLWQYDAGNIIKEAKRHNVKVVLMTYHINPTYIPADNFISLAKQYGILLVRNDQAFLSLIQDGTINDYLLHDHWHPNKKGYAIIADNVFRCIVTNNLLDLNTGN